MDLLKSLTTVARLAGLVALEHFRTKLTVETKSDGSPVTVADREAEQVARDWIHAHFPDDTVLGEEAGVQQSLSNERRWVIDPIDGTKTFVRGVPFWGTMIGIESEGSVLGGVVYCPAVEELVVAVSGEGCWHNGRRCHVSDVSDIARATILTTSSSFVGRPDREAKWRSLTQQAGLVRTWGDCYGYVLVATGRADVMVDNRLNVWDYAPLVPIIREAGGVITSWRGSVEFGGDAIATNALLSDYVRQALLEPA